MWNYCQNRPSPLLFPSHSSGLLCKVTMIKLSWIHTVYINTSESFYLSVSSYIDKSSLQDLVLLVSVLVSGLLHASCFPFFY